MTNANLDEFGKRLIQEVRNKTLSDWHRILSGQMKGIRAERIRDSLAAVVSATPQESNAVTSLIPEVVDSVLHNLLTWLEQDEDYSVSVQVQGEIMNNILASSDGLAGELYGTRGWIQTFSESK
jgi:hypothetical protein